MSAHLYSYVSQNHYSYALSTDPCFEFSEYVLEDGLIHAHVDSLFGPQSPLPSYIMTWMHHHPNTLFTQLAQVLQRYLYQQGTAAWLAPRQAICNTKVPKRSSKARVKPGWIRVHNHPLGQARLGSVVLGRHIYHQTGHLKVDRVAHVHYMQGMHVTLDSETPVCLGQTRLAHAYT